MAQTVLFELPPEPEPEPKSRQDIVDERAEALSKKRRAESEARNRLIEKRQLEDMSEGFWHSITIARKKVPTVIYVREVDYPDTTKRRFTIWQTQNIESTGGRLFEPTLPRFMTREEAMICLVKFANEKRLKHFSLK